MTGKPSIGLGMIDSRLGGPRTDAKATPEKETPRLAPNSTAVARFGRSLNIRRRRAAMIARAIVRVTDKGRPRKRYFEFATGAPIAAREGG